jgi:hypothetical protein
MDSAISPNPQQNSTSMVGPPSFHIFPADESIPAEICILYPGSSASGAARSELGWFTFWLCADADRTVKIKTSVAMRKKAIALLSLSIISSSFPTSQLLFSLSPLGPLEPSPVRIGAYGGGEQTSGEGCSTWRPMTRKSLGGFRLGELLAHAATVVLSKCETLI